MCRWWGAWGEKRSRHGREGIPQRGTRYSFCRLILYSLWEPPVTVSDAADFKASASVLNLALCLVKELLTIQVLCEYLGMVYPQHFPTPLASVPRAAFRSEQSWCCYDRHCHCEECGDGCPVLDSVGASPTGKHRFCSRISGPVPGLFTKGCREGPRCPGGAQSACWGEAGLVDGSRTIPAIEELWGFWVPCHSVPQFPLLQKCR